MEEKERIRTHEERKKERTNVKKMLNTYGKRINFVKD